MELEYKSEKIKSQCTSLKAAKKLFGGDGVLAMSLLARINALREADNIKDIIVQRTFRFHDLKNIKRKKLEGYFAVDVKTIKESWRIILRPLDENSQPYDPCNIDKIAKVVKIVEIAEVSKHYE